MYNPSALCEIAHALYLYSDSLFRRASYPRQYCKTFPM